MTSSGQAAHSISQTLTKTLAFHSSLSSLRRPQYGSLCLGLNSRSWPRFSACMTPIRALKRCQSPRCSTRFLAKSEHDRPEWRLAIHILIDAAEDRSPMLFAKWGILYAAEKSFNPTLKDLYGRRRKLMRYR
jgi:hypothetical protein